MDVGIIPPELKLNLHEKRVGNFVPHQGKRILEKVEKGGEVDVRFFFNETRCFYEKCESYLDVYRDSSEGVTPKNVLEGDRRRLTLFRKRLTEGTFY